MAVETLYQNVSVFDTLQRLGLASVETQSIFAPQTRDKEGLTVYRDTVSGVVYIDDYYVGDQPDLSAACPSPCHKSPRA